MTKLRTKSLVGSVVLLLCLCTVSPFLAQEHTKPSGGLDWIGQEFDGGAISISCPAKLTIVDNADTSNASVQNFTYVAVANTTWFVLQYSALKDDTDEWSSAAKMVFYDAFWQSVQPSLDATFKKQDPSLSVELKEKRATRLGQSDGIEFLYTVGRLKGSMRLIVKGHRAYCAGILAPPDLYADWSARFFGSCKV